MANRVGKYKISKRENTLSAFGDVGGTVPGALTLSSDTIKITGLANTTLSASLVSNQLFITSSNYFSSSTTQGIGKEGAGDADIGFDVLCLTR